MRRAATARWLTGVVFLLASPLVYLNVLDAFFVADDFALLEVVRNEGPWARWFAGGKFLRPLINLSVELELRLWGLRPFGYHLTNVLVHGANAFLVVLVAGKLRDETGGPPGLERRHRSLPVLAGALFLVLPCHAEAVAWISGRTDVMATFFCLLALYGYLLWRERRRWWLFGLSSISFAAALLAKESAVVLPGILLAYEAVLGRRRALRRSVVVAAQGGYVAVLAAYFWLRSLLGVATLDHLRLDPASAAENLTLHVVKTLTTYWPMALWPWRAVLDEHRGAVLALLLGAVVAAAVVRRILRRPPDARPAAWRGPVFLATAWAVALAPAVPLPTRLFTSESDRFLYLPSAFACILMAVALCRAVRGRALAVAGALALLLYGGLLHRATDNWRKAGEIAESVLESLPSHPASSPLVVLSLPDNLAGAFIFRNGFHHAAALFHGEGRERTLGLASTFEMLDETDAVRVLTTPEGVSLTPTNPRSTLRAHGETPSCVIPRVVGNPRRLELDIGSCGPDVRFAVYERGELVPVRLRG